jgi:hypothetical protein
VVVEAERVRGFELLEVTGGAVDLGAHEPCEVLTTAKINTRTRITAVAPAAKMTDGRSNHDFTSSSSSDTPKC